MHKPTAKNIRLLYPEEKAIHEKTMDKIRWSVRTLSEIYRYRSRMTLVSASILCLYMLW